MRTSPLPFLDPEFRIQFFHAPVVPPDDCQVDDQGALSCHVETQREAEYDYFVDAPGKPGQAEGKQQPEGQQKKGQTPGPAPVSIAGGHRCAITFCMRMVRRKLAERGSGRVIRLIRMMVRNPATTPNNPLEVDCTWNHGSMRKPLRPSQGILSNSTRRM